jgi:hypothetical protein
MKNLFTIISDIRNLYSSRDSIWKELFKLQQTAKKRDKELLNRIHKLERKLHELPDNARGRGDSDVQFRVTRLFLAE